MGQVLCEIRILDGTETLTHYAIWNNTTDMVEKEHPLFDSRKTGELYMKLIGKRPEVQEELKNVFHLITLEGLQEFAIRKLMED